MGRIDKCIKILAFSILSQLRDQCLHIITYEGVCVNYRNPDPRRGEPRVGSAPDVAFPPDPVDPLDLLDPLQNSVRLSNVVFYNDFFYFLPELGTYFWP